MATKEEVILYAKGFADIGIGVDADGVFGTQCVDLPNQIAQTYFGQVLWGNAIDLLNSAQSLGWEVVMDAPGVNPKAGAIFVQDTINIYGHPYGHTGLVIADSDGYTIETIEQNIDGNADALYIGGPARYNTRDFNGILGWFYPPYNDVEEHDQVNIPSTHSDDVNEITDEVELNFVDQTGKFTTKVTALNVRNQPSLYGDIVAVYEYDSSFYYDQYVDNDGYRWLCYTGATSGERRYVACGPVENGQRTLAYGEFE